jgi:hypothetical protein
MRAFVFAKTEPVKDMGKKLVRDSRSVIVIATATWRIPRKGRIAISTLLTA